MEKKRKEILEEIVGKLEWSKLSYQGVGKLSIFCCPLCGGVKEGYYGTINHIYDILQSRGNHFNIEPNMYVPATIRSQGNHYDF